jgi:hypothetical protein
MTPTSLPTGPFTCSLELRRVRAPQFVREDRHGVTYLIARNYETAYDTVPRFTSGAELPIKARIVGELSESVVIRDPAGRPLRRSGYVQGLSEISTSDGAVIFRGRYYDSRTLHELAGDDALTPAGTGLADHWENGFGEGPYAGHAFSMGGQLTRDGNGPLHGDARGQID